MARSARLKTLMEILRDGAVHRAEDLASATGVSLRTIYRDMDVMMASGLPISGARGQGYRAEASVTLPPVNLTDDEYEALHMGLAAIAASMDGPLAAAADTLAAKIDAALPDNQAALVPGQFATYPFADTAEGFTHLNTLRAALRSRQQLRIEMQDGSLHDIRPLKLTYWARLWSLIAYSDTREDFADLRVDQMQDITVLPGLFVDEPGKDVQSYQRKYGGRSR